MTASTEISDQFTLIDALNKLDEHLNTDYETEYCTDGQSQKDRDFYASFLGMDDDWAGRYIAYNGYYFTFDNEGNYISSHAKLDGVFIRTPDESIDSVLAWVKGLYPNSVDDRIKWITDTLNNTTGKRTVSISQSICALQGLFPERELVKYANKNMVHSINVEDLFYNKADDRTIHTLAAAGWNVDSNGRLMAHV